MLRERGVEADAIPGGKGQFDVIRDGELVFSKHAVGRFPGEDSCLTLVWAVLDLLITHQTNGIRFTELDRQRLNRVRYHEPDHPIPGEVPAA